MRRRSPPRPDTASRGGGGAARRIITRGREGFYWLAILFTFALGTAAGDLFAKKLSVGYWPSPLLFGGVIAAITVAHLRFGPTDRVDRHARPLAGSLGYLAGALVGSGCFCFAAAGWSLGSRWEAFHRGFRFAGAAETFAAAR